MQRKIDGFTLLELMITVVIFGILAIIAYPSYTNYLMKSRRADAIAALTRFQMILERCYAQNFSYATACPSLPSFPQTSDQGYYSIDLSNLGTSTYTLTATPLGTQVKDTTCSSMSIDQANTKTASDDSCWNAS